MPWLRTTGLDTQASCGPVREPVKEIANDNTV